MQQFLIPFLFCILFIGSFSFLLHYFASALWVRITGFIIFVTVAPLAWFLISNAMSIPKPMEIAFIEQIQDKEYTLNAVVLDSPNAIYVWVTPIEEEKSGPEIPLSYALPWNEDQAEKLRKTMKEAQRQSVEPRVVGLFKGFGENESEGKNIIVPNIKPKPDREIILGGPLKIDAE